jgi:hypothetical protein
LRRARLAVDQNEFDLRTCGNLLFSVSSYRIAVGAELQKQLIAFRLVGCEREAGDVDQ